MDQKQICLYSKTIVKYIYLFIVQRWTRISKATRDKKQKNEKQKTSSY